MTTKSPYEIRLEMLKLAQDQANQRYYTEWEKASQKANINENATYLTEVPQFPSSEDILAEAEKFKKFVDRS